MPTNRFHNYRPAIDLEISELVDQDQRQEGPVDKFGIIITYTNCSMLHYFCLEFEYFIGYFSVYTFYVCTVTTHEHLY